MSLQSIRKYKVTIILDTRGYDAPVETLQEKVSGLISQAGASVESLDNLGRYDFVRITDKGQPVDTYLQVVVSGPATLPASFQEQTRLDKLIKRSLFQSI